MIGSQSVSLMVAMMSTSPFICPMPAQEAQDITKAVEKVEEIIADYQAEDKDFFAKARALKSNEDRQELYAGGPPDASPHFEKLHEIAKAYAGSEAAGEAAKWVLMQSSRRDTDYSSGNWALEMLLSDFMDSEYIENVPSLCSSMTTRNAEALERVRTESTVQRAKALADLIRGQQLVMMSNAAKELTEKGSSGDPYMPFYVHSIDDELKSKLASVGMAEECLKAGEALLRHCREAYRDVAFGQGSGEMIAAKAACQLFEMNNLQIGDVAPDIVGVDAEGVEFKLSDYRGQVVVISFWAFWCGPCRALIPQERSLVEKLVDEPFTLLGVNSDTQEAYDAEVESMGVTWRSFMQGSAKGVISTTWNIPGWPFIYVVDANGVIRYKGALRNEALDEAVMALLEEIKTGP